MKESLKAQYGEAFDIWYSDCYGCYTDEDELQEAFEDDYQGEYKSMKDYAYQLADDLGYFDTAAKEFGTSSYFDVDQFSTDLEASGDYYFSRGHVYVFRTV